MVVVPGLVIRPMRAADSAEVSRVGYAAWNSNIPEPYHDSAHVLSALRQNFENFAEKSASQITVAKIDGILVGWGARDNRLDPGNLSSDTNHISDLWVDPPYQGQGIGTALLKAMIAEIAAWHYETVTIDIAQSNQKAKRLYTRIDFQELERTTLYSKILKCNVPVIILEKYIAL
jgi:ribosomal-protein-alanine N-acetyltransferase